MIVTLTGKTASGKSCIEQELIAMGYSQVVSDTTRPPRAGEVNGVNYHFVTPAVFNEKTRHGDFIETNQFGDHWYGKSFSALGQALANPSGKAVMVIEPIGAKNMHAFAREVGMSIMGVWVQCDEVVRQARLQARGGDPVELARRQRLIDTIEKDWGQFVDSGDCMMTVPAGRMTPRQLAVLIDSTIDFAMTMPENPTVSSEL
jgi:guanylate kinase